MQDATLQIDTPFDQYSRQYQVAAMINDLRHGNETFTILDVGGYKGKTAEFSPKDNVTVLDVFDIKAPNYIKGDGLNLPFENDSFDFVLNFDVLEHIPGDKRHRFIDECNRVAKKAAIFSAPHKTPENEIAEQNLNEFYKSLHGEDHPWLKEHIAYVLPDNVDLQKYTQKKGFYTSMFPSNDTMIWVLLQGTLFLNSKYPMGAPKLVEINGYYNKHFPYDGGSDEAHTYRLIMCVCKSEADNKKLVADFSKRNKPLTLSQRLKLMQMVQEYYALVLTKLSEELAAVHQLHEHEADRAATLHKSSEQLWHRINLLEAEKQKPNSLGLIRRKIKHKREKHEKNS
jgi:hypothetical protein